MIKPKYKRLLLGLAVLISISVGVLIILSALKDNIVFFYSPSELLVKHVTPEQKIRVGGLVVAGSLKKTGNHYEFDVTDTAQTLHITYDGIPPGLFREGQGVVAEGSYAERKFTATNLLAKHDENYMPPEVADAIKKSGHWQERMKTEGIKP